MIANNVPDIEIARRAGQADPATPHRLYGHVYASMKDEAANAIENALRIKEPKEPEPPKKHEQQPSAKIFSFPKKKSRLKIKTPLV